MSVIPIGIDALDTVTKGLIQRLEDLEKRDHPNYSIIAIGQNIEKSPGDLRRLTVTKIRVKNHQLTPVWKTLKRIIIMIMIISLNIKFNVPVDMPNYTRMLRAILNRSWWQHPTKHQLYGHQPPISKTIQVRRTRHAGHCWRSRDELISDILQWSPTYGRAKAGWPARTYIQQLCEDTRCSPEDLPEALNDKEKWRERVWDILAGGTIWWWYIYVCIYIYIYIYTYI